MATRKDPTVRILDGVLTAVSRYGTKRLSMTDIAHEAGISRGTLYRYFSTKEAVLSALGAYILDLYRDMIEVGVDEAPDAEARVETLVRLIASFGSRHPGLERLVGIEPSFVLSYFQANSREMIKILEDALHPAFTHRTDSARASRDAAILAEMIFRVMLSFQLTNRDLRTISTDEIAAVLSAFARTA